ncbi:MAG: NAD(P)/FAD-dependent oxidoreductase [Dehalococcoidales bacterium]|nr:NAD(P)/FAD-dependent oxidoreductase [Dehalococcoidales bacterium]
MDNKVSTVIIGGGVAGIMAAISAKRQGKLVIICEKTSQIGKKLLASGNGRCNLLNEDLSAGHFNTASRKMVEAVFTQFGKTEILAFFEELGLETYPREGRIFPYTNQAASVLKVLEMELQRLAVPIEYGFKCVGITVSKTGVTVTSESRKKIVCEHVVITGGGKSYPVYGSDGSIYEVVKQLGHTIVEPVPCGVPLIVKDSLCYTLQGQRIYAKARSYIEGKAGHPVEGELLFTKYGLSGTCIIDVSEAISIALNRYHKTNVDVSVDLVPFMKREALRTALVDRKKRPTLPEEMLIGILPNKMSVALKDLFTGGDMDNAIEALKNHRFKVNGTRGWNEAEFTSGGVNVDEIDPLTLESKLQRGVYFAGEVMDVSGERGGYNLGWAWASGYTAGQTKHSQVWV